METENDNFSTDDIILASFLLSNSTSLVDIKEDKPRHFVFVFAESNKCNELKKLFLNNALAPIRDVFSNREMLISEIKTRERNGNAYGQYK